MASKDCVLSLGSSDPTTELSRWRVMTHAILESRQGRPRVDVISTGRPRVDVILTGRPRVDVISTDRPRVDVISTDRPQVDVISMDRPRVDVILTGARPSDERAPIKLVDGRPWSPGEYLSWADP